MANDVSVKQFFGRIQLKPTIVSGHVTSVTVDQDTGQQLSALVSVGGSTIRIRLDPNTAAIAAGDQVRLEQHGQSAMADYRLVGIEAGYRPNSGVTTVLNDGTVIDGVTYNGGDLVLGKIDEGNIFTEYETGRMYHRIGSDVYGIDYPDGSRLFGHAVYGTDWEPDGPNVFIDANGVWLRDALSNVLTLDSVNGIQMFSGAEQRVEIAPDGTGWLGGADKFYWDADGNVTMSGSLLTGAGTIFMNEDGFWLGDTDSGAGLTLNEVKDVYGVGTGSFGLRIYDEAGVAHISLLSRAGDTPLFRLGTPAADTWLQWDENGLELKGTITATDGSITGSLYVGSDEPRILIDGANKLIQSTNYYKGVSGFNLDGVTGSAEFEDITARGTIKTAVFQKSLVTAFAGSQVVAKSASVTAAETTLGSPTFSLAVKSQDEDAAPFEDGDLIYIKTELLSVYAIVNTGSRGGNLLLNSTFNVDADSNGIGDGWAQYNNTVGTEPGTLSIIASGGVDNGRFQRISWSVSNTSSKGVYTSPVNWQPNTTYVISFYAKANLNTYQRMGLGWNFFPASTTELSNPTLTASWQRYAWRITTGATPDTALFITIDYAQPCIGSLDLDHVMVEATGDLNDWKADDFYSYTATYNSGATEGVVPVGTAVTDYGTNGDGRLFLTADDDVSAGESPYLSIATHNMEAPPVWTERARLGNLEGLVTGGGYGLWTDNGWFTGIVTASVIRSAVDGARIEMNTEKIFGTDGTDEQWYAQSADGKLYAGQGAIVLDYDGLHINSSDQNDNTLEFTSGGFSTGFITGWLGARYSGDTGSGTQLRLTTGLTGTAETSEIDLLAAGETSNDLAHLTVTSGGGGAQSAILLSANSIGVTGYLNAYNDLRAVRGEAAYTGGIFVPLVTPATTIAWSGTTFSTTSPQPLQVVSTFGIPSDAKAILATLSVLDSAGAGNYYCSLGPNNTYYYALVCRSVSASYYNEVGPGPVPCQNGDVYYRILSSGAGTLTVTLRIWGYWL